MRKLKKGISLFAMAVLIGASVMGCGNKDGKNFDTAKDISMITREDGSGTRGAFMELFEIENMTDEAITTSSTAVMLTSVSGDKYAVGYVSLGSINDTVKSLKVDGVEATVPNIKSGSYKIARPFNIVTKGTVSEAAQDFINFIMSNDGQNVIEGKGYIAVDDAAPIFTSNSAKGKIVVAGSSSVTPVMEKLKEAYLGLNKEAIIEIQESDSTTGVEATSAGTCDIGMASRELKDSEVEKGLVSTVIAMDGIAVIVNKENTLDDISSEQVKKIYSGEVMEWSEIIK